MLLDVDHFKEINDSLGHQTGDLVLFEIARRLIDTLRVSDTVGRLGSDEFAVLLPEVDDDLSAAAAATKVREALAAPFKVDDLDVEMAATAGIALYPDHGEDPELLLQHAEVAMYNAKQSPRGPRALRGGPGRVLPQPPAPGGRAPQRDRERRPRVALPAQGPAQRQHRGRRRGARALEPSRARAARPRPLRPARGAHRPDPGRSPSRC